MFHPKIHHHFFVFLFFLPGCCCSKSLLMLHTYPTHIHPSVTAEDWFLTKTMSLLVNDKTSIISSWRLLDRLPLVTHPCLLRVCNRDAQKNTQSNHVSIKCSGWMAGKQHAVTRPGNASGHPSNTQTRRAHVKVCIDHVCQ